MDPRAKSAGNVVMVGAGPIGLAHAWGIKQLNPAIQIRVFEKYETYQRDHTLRMEPEHLAELMRVTDTQQDKELSALLKKLRTNKNILTTELERIFKKKAEESGVQFHCGPEYEIKEDTYLRHLYSSNFLPDLIIGADGTHSAVSRCLFSPDNQVKHEFDYVLQLRYTMQGDHKAIKTSFSGLLDGMARHGMVASEHVGRFNEEKQSTPIGMSLMISRKHYYALQKATSKNSLRPFATEERHSELDMSQVPTEVKSFINHYLSLRIRNSHGLRIERETLRISVNEAPATHAKEVVRPALTSASAVAVAQVDDSTEEGLRALKLAHIPRVLVGDAALGLSYFKGLNAGYEATAKFLSTLAPLLKKGLNNHQETTTALHDYQKWFLNEFALKKVEEVARHSKWQIKSVEHAAEMVLKLTNVSIGGGPYDGDYDTLIENYFSMRIEGHERGWRLYPHRAYDRVKLGQFENVPIRHSLMKIKKLFVDYFKPYKSNFQIKQDFKQPLVGLNNFFVGAFKIIAGLIIFDGEYFGEGIFIFLRGTLEIGTTPLAWLLKPLTRSIATFLYGWPKIEENAGIKRIVEYGTHYLHNIEEESSGEEKDEIMLSTQQITDLFAVCNDLHRKFGKSTRRGQQSDIRGMTEPDAFFQVKQSMQEPAEYKKHVADYLSLFLIKPTETSTALSQETPPLASSVSLVGPP
ncbi:MAG: uncharacterized protein K0S27_1086 [Gammaproteobacteria bacterium]|jgi:2-polyprenyl-6-methoxyphenol hydroxylase-like FAD-dependent oxidoreductase|nr:uncharacterized protein [Gammaproteobacteria bacterium]